MDGTTHIAEDYAYWEWRLSGTEYWWEGLGEDARLEKAVRWDRQLERLRISGKGGSAPEFVKASGEAVNDE